MSEPRILLIGGDGQVGWELRRTLSPLGRIIPTSLCGSWGPRLDLTDPDAIRKIVGQADPGLIVNASAYTAVDRAEEEAETAQRVNGDALGIIGELAAKRRIPVVHYSTDYVFAGDADRPYKEDDPTGPLAAYGRTKLDGERQLFASGADAIVLRTAWVYGARGENFLLTMRKLFGQRNELRIVDDQIGAPTWSRQLAEATSQILAQTAADGFRFGDRAGVYHLTSAGRTSWYGFASVIRDLLGQPCKLLPIPGSEYPTPAKRPSFSVLDNSKIEETFGIRLPDWQEALLLCIEDLRLMA